MSGIVVVMEQNGGDWHRMSFETLAAAQQLGQALDLPVAAAVLGHHTADLAGDLSSRKIDQVFSLEHPLLELYTSDAYTLALEQLIRAKQPQYVLFPHTYQVRDFAPKLATRFTRVLVSDVVEIRAEAGTPVFVRQLFQGKLNSDVRCTADAPNFASVQAGAYRADQVAAAESSAAIENIAVQLEPSQIRTRPEAPFREAQRAVDLTSAEIIVSVGRGIKEKENLLIVEELAQALGAELAASRPICDSGWLPMERQVGSSGQTVSPKVYIAIGISGAIQHLVGMKGSRTIVAINKDPEAPIFEVADYGVVGDLFEVVPALTEAIKKARS
jgi:electron transfer flavoprotein alpha subunit